MARHKDCSINLPEVKNNTRDWESIKVGFLWDLRDELKEQNRLARDQLDVLRRIDRRLAKYMPLTTRKA